MRIPTVVHVRPSMWNVQMSNVHVYFLDAFPASHPVNCTSPALQKRDQCMATMSSLPSFVLPQRHFVVLHTTGTPAYPTPCAKLRTMSLSLGRNFRNFRYLCEQPLHELENAQAATRETRLRLRVLLVCNLATMPNIYRQHAWTNLIANRAKSRRLRNYDRL